MKSTSKAIALAASAALWSPRSASAVCQNICGPGVVDFSNTSPAAAPVNASPDPHYGERVNAAIQFGMSCNMPTCADDCGRPDYGEEYQVRLFSRLAAAAAGDTSKLQEAIDSLRNIQASELGAIGTDSPASGVCSVPVIGGPLATLINVFSNVARHGDGDTAMMGFINILYKYGPSPGANLLPQDVYDHLLSLVVLSPGLGSVEHLSFGIDALTVCPLVCAPGVNPYLVACGAACALAASVERLQTPESENHINMIYASQYLANQLWFQKTNDPQYDNAQNGYRSALINRLKSFVRNDFIEYNSHNYEDFDMFALLSLASYAADPAVKSAAKMVLDYLSAKVAVSSNDARRSVPFRRRNEDKHTCDELIRQECADPFTPFYMMLAGNWDILQNSVDPPAKKAPYTYSTEFLWTATTDYKLETLLLDLLVDRSHRKFYQFFHNTRKLETDDFSDVSEELYSGSPSFLISAGGRSTHYSYTAEVPFPFSLIPAFGINNELTGFPFPVSHPGNDSDKGFAPPTTVMPTGALHSRTQMIRFDASMCVGRNFACGTNPLFGICGVGDDPDKCAPASTYSTIDGPLSPPAPGDHSWTFLEYSSPALGAVAAGTYGFYAAVYQQDGFGFVEVYDKFGAPSITSLKAFEDQVLANNGGKTFSGTGTNSYTNADGKVIQFSISDGKIVSFDGAPPYDPNRTNGDVINNDGTGVVTITNPATKQSLTLDASAPPGHPQITIPGPLTFADTCVGSTSLATLNICNGGNGADELEIFNILSLTNSQFQVTEPTSGYPTPIGSNFCFPFQASFSPVMTGAISAKLTISNSDPTVPELKLAVSGNGIQQTIATLIANAGDFGNVCVGSFTDLNLTINNAGGCDLLVSSVTSSMPADFTVAAALSFPLKVHAGDSLQVPIRLHPSKFGATSANIIVASNDPKSPNAMVAVSGNAPPPVINASIVDSGNFGNVCAGTHSDLGLQVLNQGLCPLTISSVTPGGGPNFILPSVTTFPLVLGASGSVILPIRFQPPAFNTPGYVTCSDTVPQTGSIAIHSDDPLYADPAGFVRSVSGIEGCPQLVLSPNNLTGAFAFPATVSDPNGSLGCFTDRQITVGNSGTCPLSIIGLTTSNGTDGTGTALPASPLEFTVTSPTVPVTINPGAAPVPITVRFRPTILTDQNASAPDQQTGMLSIDSNDPVAADNSAALCGEPTTQSGARVLVVNGSTTPVTSVASISLTSKGLTPPFSQTLKPATLLTAPSICGNPVRYHLDNETLRPAGTTGNNPKASYVLSAKNGSTQANMSFTLGQCQVQQIVLQIK